MPIGPDFTRTPREDEHGEIHALLVAAFGRADEADIVRRLRADGEMWIELVKPWDGAIAGYAALSRMRAPQGWACLAPVAVLQRFRNGAMAPEEALRSRLHTSNPSMPGNIRSKITASGSLSRALRRALSPSSAVSTV
jgi:hypothetical protein